jgi:hypothetical protein
MLQWPPPLRVDLKLYGKHFGDFVFCVGNDFLVSERFRVIYHSCGLSGLIGFDPVEITGVVTRKRRKTPSPPRYFRVGVIYGSAALDLTASGFEWLAPPTCTYCRIANIVRYQRLVLEDGTWTGADAFRPRGLSAQIMVTQRFKDLCEENKITNAFFTAAEVAGTDFYPGLKDPSELERFK